MTFTVVTQEANQRTGPVHQPSMSTMAPREVSFPHSILFDSRIYPLIASIRSQEMFAASLLRQLFFRSR